jgi:hypothetical protein
MMGLPKELESSFWGAVQDYEEQEKMSYVTTGERIGMRRGMKEALINVLEARFETVPPALKERIAAIEDSELLVDLTRRVGTVACPVEFEPMLPGPSEAGASTGEANR